MDCNSVAIPEKKSGGGPVVVKRGFTLVYVKVDDPDAKSIVVAAARLMASCVSAIVCICHCIFAIILVRLATVLASSTFAVTACCCCCCCCWRCCSCCRSNSSLCCSKVCCCCCCDSAMLSARDVSMSWNNSCMDWSKRLEVLGDWRKT
ncbi:hypothetical protein BpHYR1_042791 [Brachionus plicatilis]|uniref:Uncharacterized protein n=1 Tax=Brachionus plicatilis TaxID=10195 RepID=A0A3M7SQC1_BRAPC|nr:hypothetical protein BpHYR1_042791 [Brachionus plicatilis]